MKFIKIFIILILIIGCSNQKVADKRISKFENILGVENSETLTYLVTDFENDFLKQQYPNLKIEDAYKKFLTELRDGKTKMLNNLPKKSFDFFEKSKLKRELYSYPDSVWILENSEMDKIEKDSMLFINSRFPYLKLRYKYLNENGTIDYNYSRIHTDIKPNSNYDSIINLYLRMASYNGANKYIQALYAIKESDTLLKKYLSAKNIGDLLPLSFFARGTLDLDPDFTDYFHKRIVVLEIIF